MPELPVPKGSVQGESRTSSGGVVRQHRLRRIGRIGLMLASVLLIVLGLAYLTVRHVIWPDLERWRPQMEQFLSARIGLPVQIQQIAGEFEGFSPSVRLSELRIGEPRTAPVLLVKQAQAVLSWRTIFNGRPNFEFLQANELTLQVERITDRRFVIAGIPLDIPLMQSRINRPSLLEPWLLPDWLMRQQSVSLPLINLHYRDRKTGQSAKFSRLQFRSDGTTTERTLRLVVSGEGALTGAGEFKARLSRAGLANPTQVRRWQGEALAEMVDINLPALTNLLRLPAPLVAGSANAQAKFRVVNSKPSDALVSIDGQGWQVNANHPEERFETVQAVVNAGWRTNGNVDFTVLEARAVDQTGAVIALGNKAQILTLRPDLLPVRARFSLREFDADRLMTMARTLPFPSALREQLVAIKLAGRVDQINVDFDARSGTPRFALDARFTGLDLAFGPEAELAQPIRKWGPRPPWFEQLTGTLEMTEAGGSLRVNSPQASVGLPGIFAEPKVPLRALEAEIDWTIESVLSPSTRELGLDAASAVVSANGETTTDLSGLSVNIKRLKFENEDAGASISGIWRGAGQSRRGIIDLQARLKRAQMRRVHRYLPMDIPPDVRQWVKTALIGGTSDDVKFVLQGDLIDFPFREPHTGQILIEAKVQDGTLKFLPDFPPATGWNGNFKIERSGMVATANSGQVLKSNISDLTVSIAEFKQAVLKLDGKIKGSAQEAVRFVNTTPLTELVDGFLAESRISGTAATRLSMTIPLKNPKEGVVKGQTTLAGSRVKLAPFLPRMSDVRGEVEYGTAGFSAEKLKVRMYGGKASITASTPTKGQLELQIKGAASATGLRAEVDTPITRALAGTTRYQAKLSIAESGLRMNVTSDLKGMASSLPEPLRKAANLSLPLSIQVRPVRLAGRKPARWGDRLAIKVGADMQAIFERDPVDKIASKKPAKGRRSFDLLVKRGVITVDSLPVMPEQGLSLSINTRVLNMDRWLEALEITGKPDAMLGAAGKKNLPSKQASGKKVARTRASSAPESGYFRGFELEPTRASLLSRLMIYNSKKFTDVVLGASRTGRIWDANISTQQVNGYINWIGQGDQPEQQPQLIGKFQRLEIPDTRTTEFEGLLNMSPQSLPALDIQADDFVLTGRSLGRLQLNASNRADGGGWEISRLSLEHPTARLAGTGLWTRSNSGKQQSQLNFDLDILNAGDLLAVLGQPDTMRNGSGKLSGQLGWRGAPGNIDIPSLGGKVSLALGPGQFLRTEPGIAKLVGVLSLQSIPRRLSLDFSDVFAAGFAFDTVVGTATVELGKLQTENLLMNGVQAQVRVKGQADLLAETQNLTVEVLPTINAGLASIAYAAVANPAVGIGTLVAQLLLQDPLRQLFRYEFELEGPWADPKVTQIRPRDPDPPNDPVYGPG